MPTEAKNVVLYLLAAFILVFGAVSWFIDIPYFIQVWFAPISFFPATYFILEFKNEEGQNEDFFVKLALIHVFAVLSACFLFPKYILDSLFFKIPYFAYLIFASILFFKSILSVAERERSQKEFEKSERLAFSQYYRPKLAKLAEALASIDATKAAEPLRSTLANVLASFSEISLNPKDTTWYESDDVFLLATENVPLEILKAVPQKVFTLPDGTTDPDGVCRSLAKDILIDRLKRAPAEGWHVYGLPHPHADYLHRSPYPEHYGVKPDDRFKHAYIIGKTGAGKTTLLRNLILQDIMRGDGVMVMSPESGLFDFLLEHYPRYRESDLIYYDPTDDEPPIVSLNPVAIEKGQKLQDRAGAISDTLSRAMADDLSPAMHNLMQNSVRTLLQLPDTSFQDLRALLKPVSPLRASLPTHPKLDDITREYWRDEYEKGSYIKKSAEALLSRLGAFFMSPLSFTVSVASFPFQEALNGRRSVFFFDLSRIHGNQEAILGQLIVSHILQTLLGRDSENEADRMPYHFYIDEFQRFAEQSESAFRDLFNRARKYRASVTLAHQVTADIPTKLLEVILGNVGTTVCMELAPKDAEFFARQINLTRYGRQRYEAAQYLERLNKGAAFIKIPTQHDATHIQVSQEPLLSEGSRPFSDIAALKSYSKARYGKNPATPSPSPKPSRESQHAPDAEGNEGAEFDIS